MRSPRFLVWPQCLAAGCGPTLTDRSRVVPARRRKLTQVSVYSGPEPPSGGVSRPPFAVIAPHWTQFDGDTLTSTSRPRPARPRRPAPGTCAPTAGQLARHARLHAEVARLVVARAVPREEHRRELVERELAVGRRVLGRAAGREELVRVVALGRPVAAREPAARERRRARPRDARATGRPRTTAACSARAAGRSRRTTTAARRRTPRARRRASDAPRRLRREPPRLDRVVDPLQRRHVDEPDAVAAQQQPGAWNAPRQRDEAALGDRLRAPLDPLAAVEDRAACAGASSAPGAGRAPRAPRRGSRARRPCRCSRAPRPSGRRTSRRTRGSARRRAAASRACGSRCRSGRGTFQTSFTPSAHVCGLDPARPKCPSAAPVRWPALPSARIVTRARMSEPGSKRGELLALAAAALVAGAHADDRAVLDEQPRRRRLGQHHRAEPLGPLGERAPELRERDDDVAVVPHRRRRRHAHARGRASGSTRPRPAPRRTRGSRRRRAAAAAGRDRAPRPRAGASRAPCPSRAPRPAPRRAPPAVSASAAASWPSRIAAASPAGPAPTTSTPTSIGSASDGSPIASASLHGGGKSAGLTRCGARARAASARGTISFRSPTTPRSAYSKIGACGSLLIATIVPEPCIPTLCWIAPEMPTAT